MPWKQFVRKYTYRERSTNPEASIWKKNHTICFKAAAVNAFNLNKSRYVEAFYDEKRKALGFKIHSTPPNKNKKHIVLATKSKTNILVSAKPIFSEFNIDADNFVGESFPLEQENDMIVMILKK